MTTQIRIFDTTLRDGEQSAGVCFSADDKLAVATQLESMGVDVIEAGFPASSGAEAQAVDGVARSVRRSTVCALARAVAGDIDAAARALEGAARPRIHVFINTSDVQLAHQLRRGREQVLAAVSTMVARARQHVDDVEFSPMDATRADSAFLTQVVEAAVSAGAATVNLPDTVGCATPDQVAEMVRGVRAGVASDRPYTISFHGQDDLGLATANALAAVCAGAGQVEVAVNGIGERAGNTALEEVVMALRIHGPRLGASCHVDTTGIHAVSRLVEERSRMPIANNKAVVGRNAFRHASGIHQDGVIKHRETYEAIDPAWVGHPVGTEIVLGKLSGRAGFSARARALGFALSEVELARAFGAFQSLAGQGGEVDDISVRELCMAATA